MRLLLWIAVALALASCAGKASQTPPPGAANLEVTSPAFSAGGAIPLAYTCDGKNASPALQWSGTPEGTRSIALVTEDPDAPGGTFIHWVVYNIPPASRGLPEGLPPDDSSYTQGRTSFNRVGYGGPCPPRGKPHRYFFKLFALDLEPNQKGGMSAAELYKAMEGHILAQGELVGTYQR